VKLTDRPLRTTKRSGSHSFQTEKPELEPCYLRISQASYYFGVSRSRLFSLIAEGVIRSRLILQAGRIRGVRLIDVRSLRDYVESWDSEGKRIKRKEVEA